MSLRKSVRWLKRFGWSEEEIKQILAEKRGLPTRKLIWLKLSVFDGLRSLGYSVGEARKIVHLSKKALTEYRWVLHEPDVTEVLGG